MAARVAKETFFIEFGVRLACLRGSNVAGKLANCIAQDLQLVVRVFFVNPGISVTD
jgi:hypothetical protein